MYRRIRDLREDRDLKQQDLARLLNCTQACYSNYENGRRDIPTEALITLAQFYGVSVDYLLGRTDAKAPYPNPESSSLRQPGLVFLCPEPSDTIVGKQQAKLVFV